MKKTGGNLARNLFGKNSFPAKKVLVSVIIFLALCFILSYILRVLRSSDYFKVTDIFIKDSGGVDLTYLKGRNIFDIDLKAESRYLINSYPNLSKVRLVRVLPNRIFADFLARKPVALVKLYRYFAIDENGTFFYPLDNAGINELPVIAGLETKIFGPRPGKRYNTKEISLALNIIKEIKNNKILKDYKIQRIDVSSAANAAIFLLVPQKDFPRGETGVFGGFNIVEVKIGHDDLKHKIDILAGWFAQPKNNAVNLKYVDLRFNEAVVKFKDAKF